MSLPIDYCYHCHTYRCGHADGEDEQYVLAAIRNGIKVLAFTDHVPFPSFYQTGIRMESKQMADYLSSIRLLKEKYKDLIEIHVGFEAEYMPQYDSYLRDLLASGTIDLLILGQHGRTVDGRWKWYNNEFGSAANARQYGHDIIRGMRSGLFSLVAHPDLFINGYGAIDDISTGICLDIAEESVKLGLPIEPNCQGDFLGKGLDHCYPDPDCWDIFGRVKGVKGIIGMDAHFPGAFDDYSHCRKCLAIAKHSGISLVERIEFRKG